MRKLVALAGVLASLALAQAAAAETYCVHKPGDPCPANNGEFTGLQPALDAAFVHPGLDRVVIGPGRFDSPFISTYTAPAGNPVEITGAGPATRLGSSFATVLALSAAGSKVQNVSLSVPSGGTGVDLGDEATLRGVTINGTTGTAVFLHGVPATLDGLNVAMDAGAGSVAVASDSPGSSSQRIDVTGSTLTARTAILGTRGPAFNVSRSTLTGWRGVDVTNADVTVQNTLIVKSQAGGLPLRLTASETHALGVTNVTAIDQAGDSGGSDRGFDVVTNPGGIVPTFVTASLFGGFDSPSSAGSGAALHLDAVESYPNLADVPVVDGPGGNYHLPASSPLIDRAPDSAAAALDLDGNTRLVDARPPPGRSLDIGAFEFQPHAPTVRLTASNSRPAAGENVTFSAAAADPDPGDELAYLWSFDGGPSAGGGATATRSFSTTGPHTASVTVIDLSRRTASASATVVVSSLPAPTNPFRAGTCINSFNGTPAADRLRGSPFGDAMVGGGGNDILSGLGGDDCLIGDEGNDKLNGGEGDDDLRGLAGNDRLLGANGSDNLLGGAGKDSLNGGAGNDTLNGGAAVDRLKGGAGKDTINAADRRRENVNCGSGRDTVKADRIDRVVSCEKKRLSGRRR